MLTEKEPIIGFFFYRVKCEGKKILICIFLGTHSNQLSISFENCKKTCCVCGIFSLSLVVIIAIVNQFPHVLHFFSINSTIQLRLLKSCTETKGNKIIYKHYNYKSKKVILKIIQIIRVYLNWRLFLVTKIIYRWFLVEYTVTLR